MTRHELKLGDLVLAVPEVRDDVFAALADFLATRDAGEPLVTLEIEQPMLTADWFDTDGFLHTRRSENLTFKVDVKMRRTKERRYREVVD